MRVHALGVAGYRNLREQVVELGPGFNVIVGDNGQGKTNLLEAIYLLGTLRSFRTSHLAELICHGRGSAEVHARVHTGGMDRHYEVVISPRRREVRLDGKTPRALADYFGGFNVVLFAPEDLRVPRDAPAGRRRFLDRTVFTRKPSFLAEAQRYARVLKSRNAILRDGHADQAQLDVYDVQLASEGAKVLASRREVLAELGPIFSETFASLTRTGLVAEVSYESEVPASDPSGLLAALTASRPRDLARRATSVGPHTDDLHFALDGQSARAFASQGQLRALVLAWKIAEIILVARHAGAPPLLLLDDVSSELDQTRNAQLFEFVAGIGCQCVVTTTHESHVAVSQNRKYFQVVAGSISAA